MRRILVLVELVEKLSSLLIYIWKSKQLRPETVDVNIIFPIASTMNWIMVRIEILLVIFFNLVRNFL